VTTIIGAVFPIYFSKVAAAGLPPAVATQRFAMATTVSLVFVAVASPILGALADTAGVKKKLLGAFMAIGLVSTALMFFIHRGDWRFAAGLFVLANIGVAGSFVFYDALLPHVARREEMDRLSTTGYALGYLGGGLLLALNLAWIQKPAWFGLPSGPGLTDEQATLPARLSFLSVAVWWLLFAIPLFRRVPEPPRAPEGRANPGQSLLAATFTGLARTFRDLRRFRQALLMLVAFLIYNDGIGTIIRMAASYGTELGIDQSALIGALLLVQFVGIPFAIGFGALASRIGARQAIFLSLAVYAGISVLGYHMKSAREFYALAVLVGMVQGGSQALSRSLFASMIPRDRSAEFFGLFSIFEKFAGILGPAIFAATIAMTGSSRHAILSVIAFFVVGGLLLAGVNVEEGRRAAVEAEREGGAG
jgi:UMF1 family MFS transporter